MTLASGGTWGFILFLLALTMLTSAAAQEPVEFTLFIDTDSLTLYVPESGVVSLVGFGFQVQVNGTTRNYDLSDYPAFGMPLGQIPTPICFRLRLSGSRTPLPLACNGANTLTQDLAAADGFWYDSVSEVARIILLTKGDVPFTLCATGSNECSNEYLPPLPTPTPIPTFVPQHLSFPERHLTLDLPEGWVHNPRGWDYNHDITSISSRLQVYSSQEIMERVGSNSWTDLEFENGEYLVEILLFDIGDPIFGEISSFEDVVAMLSSLGGSSNEVIYSDLDGDQAIRTEFEWPGGSAGTLIVDYSDNGYYLVIMSFTNENGNLFSIVEQIATSIQRTSDENP